MKPRYYFILIIFLIVCFHPVSAFSQQTEKVSQMKTTPQRAAEGQTKWMMNELKLNISLYKSIYDINLRYHLKADSIHTSNTAITAKRVSYLHYSQVRDEELKKVLPVETYNNYQAIVEAIKTKAPGR